MSSLAYVEAPLEHLDTLARSHPLIQLAPRKTRHLCYDSMYCTALTRPLLHCISLRMKQQEAQRLCN
jgi:hypothetical protein